MNIKGGWIAGIVAAAAITGAEVHGVAAAAMKSDTDSNKELVRQFGGMFGDAEHLEASAEHFLAVDYIQHDPMAPQGRAGFVKFFKQWYREHPNVTAKTQKQRSYVMMVAQGDLVVAVSKDELPDPSRPGSTYDAFFFDMWRVQGGKLAEHWDDIKKCQDGTAKCYWP